MQRKEYGLKIVSSDAEMRSYDPDDTVLYLVVNDAARAGLSSMYQYDALKGDFFPFTLHATPNNTAYLPHPEGFASKDSAGTITNSSTFRPTGMLGHTTTRQKVLFPMAYNKIPDQVLVISETAGVAARALDWSASGFTLEIENTNDSPAYGVVVRYIAFGR